MADVEVMRKWVEALRSGEYKQTDGYLSMNGKFCCLGVLCELAVKDGVIPPAENRDGFLHYGEDFSYVLPPREVADWAGVDKSDGWVVNVPAALPDHHVKEWGHGKVAVSHLNDAERYTFDDIADAIEETWLADTHAGQPA
jgi:hypothetical protein